MNKTIIIIMATLMAFSSAAFAAGHTSTVALTQNAKKAKAEIKEVNFHVHLHCANCVKKVQDNIAFEKGVKDLNVTLHSIAIKYDAAKTNEATLKAAVEKLGYEVLDEAHEHHDHK
jgi:Cu2+-exporting ATPase